MKNKDICEYITKLYNAIKEDSGGVYGVDNDSIDNIVVDSIEFVQLIVQIESDFNIEIPDEYLIPSELNSISKIATVIESIL